MYIIAWQPLLFKTIDIVAAYVLDEGILKRNALRWLAGKEYDDTKKEAP